MWKLPLAGFALALAASSASAQQFPRYDVERICLNADPCISYNKGIPECRAIPADLMAFRVRRAKECVAKEQIAYDDLKQRWDGLAGKTKAECTRPSRIGGNPYASIRTCVDQVQGDIDRDGALDRRDGRFHY